MEIDLLKTILSKDNWIIITLFVLYLIYRIIMGILKYKQAKNSKATLETGFSEIKSDLKVISELSKNSASKDALIDSINRKLTIIYQQYGSELSKEAAIIIIQNVYFNFANAIANEIYEFQKKDFSHEKIIRNIENRIAILNDEKRQELDIFVYRNRHLVTYTTGKIVEPDKIINIINAYSDKNGMLREEIQNLLSIEAGIVIKRLN